MLQELSITNFAIIDELRIPFGPGLNVLTGETGAGKSIIIDALGAVLGERVGPDLIRSGSPGSRVEATFEIDHASIRPELIAALAEFGIDRDEGIVILSREIASSGRSSARINGRAATAGMLTNLGSLLVDIHGQSDHLSLLRPSEHLLILDRFAGLTSARDEIAETVRNLRSVRNRINEIVSGERERAQRVDLLEFQVQEIQAASLQSGEEEALQSERTVLANSERLAVDAATAYTLLSGDSDEVETQPLPAALPALRSATAQLVSISEVDTSMQPIAERTQELLFLLEDIAGETRTYRDSIEANPPRLNEIEERLDLIRTLKRKYGATLEEVIEFGKQAHQELETLTGDETDIDLLRDEETRLTNKIGEAMTNLSGSRQVSAERLSSETEAAISELGMGRSQFDVSITQVDSDHGVPFHDRLVAFDETGADRIEFLLAPNAGEALKPLGRVASGGEMARLMLALKSILSVADETPTLVFDEVDVGVGGRSGQVVGEKLDGLAVDHQVLVITHLPQIAAFADAHFRITKAETGGRIVSRVMQITEEDRIDELAAMIDGEPPTDITRQTARQLLRRVEAWKSHEKKTTVQVGSPH